MKLIIDVPEYEYQHIKEYYEKNDIVETTYSYIYHGTPLEQKPKTGRWITWKEAGNEIPSETRFECSVCHDAAQTLCNGLDLLSPYCPNCGAKMGVRE